MRHIFPMAVDVLDPELWDDPDDLTADEGRAQYGLDRNRHDRPSSDTEDFQ